MNVLQIQYLTTLQQNTFKVTINNLLPTFNTYSPIAFELDATLWFEKKNLTASKKVDCLHIVQQKVLLLYWIKGYVDLKFNTILYKFRF